MIMVGLPALLLSVASTYSGLTDAGWSSSVAGWACSLSGDAPTQARRAVDRRRALGAGRGSSRTSSQSPIVEGFGRPIGELHDGTTFFPPRGELQVVDDGT